MVFPFASVNHTLLLLTIPNLGLAERPRFSRHAAGSASGENLSGSVVTLAQRTPKSSSPEDSRNRFSKKGITARSLGTKVWPGERQGRFTLGLYLPGSLTHASKVNSPEAKLFSVSRNSGIGVPSSGVDMKNLPIDGLCWRQLCAVFLVLRKQGAEVLIVRGYGRRFNDQHVS